MRDRLFKLCFFLFMSLFVLFLFGCISSHTEKIGNGLLAKSVAEKTSNKFESIMHHTYIFYKSTKLGILFDHESQINPEKTFCVFEENEQFFIFSTYSIKYKSLLGIGKFKDRGLFEEIVWLPIIKQVSIKFKNKKYVFNLLEYL